MTAQSATPVSRSATAVSLSRRASRNRWLLGAFLLAGAAQLITISALLSADPLTPSWSALLLAIAPVLLTAVAAFGPRPVANLAVIAAAAAMVIGIAGGTGRVGTLFIPALVAAVVAGARLWLAESR
jgi:nitrate/nitrite transporter NarK